MPPRRSTRSESCVFISVASVVVPTFAPSKTARANLAARSRARPVASWWTATRPRGHPSRRGRRRSVRPAGAGGVESGGLAQPTGVPRRVKKYCAGMTRAVMWDNGKTLGPGTTLRWAIALPRRAELCKVRYPVECETAVCPRRVGRRSGSRRPCVRARRWIRRCTSEDSRFECIGS